MNTAPTTYKGAFKAIWTPWNNFDMSYFTDIKRDFWDMINAISGIFSGIINLVCLIFAVVIFCVTSPLSAHLVVYLNKLGEVRQKEIEEKAMRDL